MKIADLRLMFETGEHLDITAKFCNDVQVPSPGCGGATDGHAQRRISKVNFQVNICVVERMVRQCWVRMEEKKNRNEDGTTMMPQSLEGKHVVGLQTPRFPSRNELTGALSPTHTLGMLRDEESGDSGFSVTRGPPFSRYRQKECKEYANIYPLV